MALCGRLDQEFRTQAKAWTHGDDLGGYSLNGVSDKQRDAMSEGGTKLNKLSEKAATPEWVKFLQQLTGFFSLLLWGGSFLCFIGYGLRADLDNLYLGIVLATVVLVTGIFSYYQDSKSASLMAQFSKMMAQEIYVRHPTKGLVKIEAHRLVRGDVVQLNPGDKVPADLIIIEQTDLKVNNAPLTGEPDALERSIECTNADKPQESENLAFFGTNCETGTGFGIVRAIADDTFIGKVAALTESTETVDTPINREIHHFIGIVSSVAMGLGISFFFISVALGTDLITNLVFMIGIIVANVPEGLLATVTVCLTLTSKSMAQKMVLVKNMEGVETLGSTTCICSDKTGTLTMNVMTFANVVYNNKTFKTDFVEDAATPPVDSTDPTFQIFLRAMKLNTTAQFEPDDMAAQPMFKYVSSFGNLVPVMQWETKGDASESSIIKFAQYMSFNIETEEEEALACHQDLMLVARERFTEVGKIPFNSTNKYHVMIVESSDEADADHPNTVYMKGAPERILPRCSEIIMDGATVEFTDELREKTNEEMGQLMEKGRRVLAFAMRPLPAAEYPKGFKFQCKKDINFPMGEEHKAGEAATAKHDKLVFVGLAALIDPPRPAVPGAVNDCQTAGIRVVMVTGDHPKTAKAIAQMVNIISGDSQTEDEIQRHNESEGLSKGDAGWQDPNLAAAIVVPGWTINPDTSDEKWKYIFAHDEIVFARTSPAQKLQIVEKFQLFEKEIVAVTGDGVNDAPALKKADIGVAMGITGTEVSKSAADMILLDDNFASIVAGVEEGRLIFDNLKKSIAYTLSSNIPEIAPFLAFITFSIPLPLSTVLILCIDLGTDMVPAISMAWENAENDIMKRPARDAAVDRLVTKKLVSFAYLQIGTFQAIGGFFTWMVVLNDYGYPPNILLGLGTFDNWGAQVLHCKLHNGIFRNEAGDPFDLAGRDQLDALEAGYYFWDPAFDGSVEACEFAARNFIANPEEWEGTLDVIDPTSFEGYTANVAVTTVQSIQALDGYVPYMPYRGVESPFWRSVWLAWDPLEAGIPGSGADVNPKLFFDAQLPGVWSINEGAEAGESVADGNSFALKATKTVLGTDMMFEGNVATFHQERAIPADATPDVAAAIEASNEISRRYGYTSLAEDGSLRFNVASRMMQKEALHHAQCAYFVSIVVVQWADLMICKTRWLSISDQGMVNPAMNFGLIFETILAAWICYLPGVGDALGTRDIRFLHWFAAVPFSAIILLYDEIRKAIMRATSPQLVVGKQIVRDYGWLARQTYY